jgi:hypothetical protein
LKFRLRRAWVTIQKGDDVEVRYMGFEQGQNARAYQFDVVEKGQRSRRLIVTADLSLFRTHGVLIQEGVSLCSRKLMADLERDFVGTHELTPEDLRAHLNARSLAVEKRAAMRKAHRA